MRQLIRQLRRGCKTTTLVLVLCGVPGTLPAEEANGGRPDLLPRKVRWRTFPSDVRRVTIDRRGRPWYEIEGSVSREALQRQTELACRLPAPWIRGAAVSLFDSQGRVWLRPDNEWTVLLGFDPATGKWIERKSTPVPDGKGGADPVAFHDPSHESRSGRLYFTDRQGVHVFDAGKWSYQPLYQLNRKHALYHDSISAFDEPRMAEDDRGRVFVWTRWGRYGWTGTVGFFIHDGKTWAHRQLAPLRLDVKGKPPREKDSPDNPDLNRLSDVIPLTGERAVVCTESGPAFLVPVKEETIDEKDIERQIDRDIALLGADAFEAREAASERLAEAGLKALPQMRRALERAKDPEMIRRLRDLLEKAEAAGLIPQVDGHQLIYTRAHGVDRHGRTWLWVDRCVLPGGREERGVFVLVTRDGKVLAGPEGSRGWYPDSLFADRKGKVYLARYGKGCIALDGEKVLPVTDPTQTDLRYVLGEDRAGRIYLSNERSVIAYLPGAPEERPGLPTTIYEVPRGENDVLRDSAGRVWAVLLEEGMRAGSLAVFEKGAWRRTTLPGGKPVEELLFFMPLKEGCLIAQDKSSRHGYFHDGDAWHEHASLKDLVEKRHERLAELIDNRRWGRDFYAKLRVDAAGRIWLAEWMEGAVWDGKRWLDLIAPLDRVAPRGKFDMFSFLIPLPGGKQMLAVSGLSETCFALSIEEDKVKAVPYPLPAGGRLDSDYTTRSGMWLDGRGRIWFPQGGARCLMLDEKGLHDLRETGYPRLADSRGCVWLHNPGQKTLVVLDPEGRRVTLRDDALGMDAPPVVEDRLGSVWVGTERGLLQIRVEVGNTGITLERGRLFEKDVPRGSCLWACVDRENSLWFYGPGPAHNYRLYRVELPPGGDARRAATR